MDIEVTINGKKIVTQSGLTILEAASQAGIKIPILCYLKRIKPIGSCRVCVVEIKNVNKIVSSCVAKIKEGYEIYTETEKLWEIRKEIMSQLLLDHPLDCPVCDKSGDCLLQDLTFEFGITTQKDKKIYPDRTKIFNSDLIEYNATRCVLCSRCIRVCGEMYGNPFLQIKDKGNNGYIGLKTDTKTQLGSKPAEGCSFEEISVEPDHLDCYYCGNCVEVCPVGALVSKPSKFKERYWQETPFSSICDKCSAACRIEYYRYAHGESLVRTAAPFGGYLCKSGFFYAAINGDCESYYIDNPYVKKKAVAEDVPLENALQEFYLKIKSIQENNAQDSTAVLISPSLSIDDGKISIDFVKNVLKLKNFDNNEQIELDVECKSIVEVIADAGCISFVIGDSVMSSIDMDSDLLILKEIIDSLRKQEKSVYIFPLIKPSNYRGLLNIGAYPADDSYCFSEIIKGINSGKIKNLIYIGDLIDDDYGREITHNSSNLEFLSVFSSKTSILSAMADVIVPIKDFLEERNKYYENFEGKIINVNNEFNFGIYRYNLSQVFTEISAKMGNVFNFNSNEDLLKSIKSGNIIYYNKIKGRSKFYYNDRSKLYY